MDKCPCGSKKKFEKCCRVYIEGKKTPPTPEALMRSRYTAYTTANIDYIEQTMAGVAANEFDKERSKLWAEEADWKELKIVDTHIIDSNTGVVEFIAYYSIQDKPYHIHEISKFHCEDGHWFYVEGEQPKPGRNDPCICGGGKKYKRCCGGNG